MTGNWECGWWWIFQWIWNYTVFLWWNILAYGFSWVSGWESLQLRFLEMFSILWRMLNWKRIQDIGKIKREEEIRGPRSIIEHVVGGQLFAQTICGIIKSYFEQLQSPLLSLERFKNNRRTRDETLCCYYYICIVVGELSSHLSNQRYTHAHSLKLLLDKYPECFLALAYPYISDWLGAYHSPPIQSMSVVAVGLCLWNCVDKWNEFPFCRKTNKFSLWCWSVCREEVVLCI